MKELREGTLVYDPNSDRYDICFGPEEYYGGLHCGEQFKVQICSSETTGEWTPVPVRIEFDWSKQAWYLVGLKGLELSGLRVLI